MICKICENSDESRCHLVKEMLYGSRQEFTYFECSNCGCLQLVDPPAESQKFYPADYHTQRKKNTVVRALVASRDNYLLFGKGFLGKAIGSKYPDAIFGMIGNASANTSSRILDVGCGAGLLLDRLRARGFTNLVGVDPYTKVNTNCGVLISNQTIEDLPDTDQFDVIIFNHSFEHLPDQLGSLQKASKLLAADGLCLIRMPIKVEFFWKRYGTNWYQIDAPRHYTIHTIKSFELLTRKTNLIVKEIVFDTDWFKLACSEQNARGVASKSKSSVRSGVKKSIFTSRQIKEFKKLANVLNDTGQGDQAAFCLRKRDHSR
jgi:2-polyprenyl-3-methyl-5-hydroxy-6-metoxy-1,4-benzoquinol methylase